MLFAKFRPFFIVYPAHWLGLITQLITNNQHYTNVIFYKCAAENCYGQCAVL
jgi:hypothetical protein